MAGIGCRGGSEATTTFDTEVRMMKQWLIFILLAPAMASVIGCSKETDKLMPPCVIILGGKTQTFNSKTVSREDVCKAIREFLAKRPKRKLPRSTDGCTILPSETFHIDELAGREDEVDVIIKFTNPAETTFAHLADILYSCVDASVILVGIDKYIFELPYTGPQSFERTSEIFSGQGSDIVKLRQLLLDVKAKGDVVVIEGDLSAKVSDLLSVFEIIKETRVLVMGLGVSDDEQDKGNITIVKMTDLHQN